MDNLKNSLKNGPDSRGYYGEFGARYAPEILQENLIELEKIHRRVRILFKGICRRPNPLYFAEELAIY